jgi:hypothetical protein
MSTAFTIHCLGWSSASLLLEEVRASAFKLGVIGQSEAVTDVVDTLSRHALVLSKCGNGLGCARLTPDGRIERIAVMPHPYQSQMVATMIALLNAEQQQNKTASHSTAS